MNMSFLKHERSSGKLILFWLLLWFLLVILYSDSLQYGFLVSEAHHFLYAVQIIADFLIGIYSYLAFKSSVDVISKRFFLLVFIGILVGLISTETYNLIITLFGIKISGDMVHYIWVIPYTLFLIIQIIAWAWLLAKKKNTPQDVEKTVLSRLPFIQAALITFFCIYFTGVFKSFGFSHLKFVEVSNSLLEMLLFIIVSLCMSRSRNKSLSYVATGFLFLITFNLAHRLTYMLGFDYKLFDMAWLVCYIVITFGFYLVVSEKGERIRFFEENSIHVLSSSIFIAFTTLLFIAFSFLEILTAIMQKRALTSLYVFSENVPSALIFTFMLSILLSKFVAIYLSKPLEKIIARISWVQKNNTLSMQSSDEKFLIYEIVKLDRFIVETISQLQVANRVKSDFLMNMTHDFRTPASGIYAMSKSIYQRLEDEKLKNLQKLVVDSSQQLLQLLEDVFDYTYLENHKVKSSVEKFSISELISEVIAFMQPKAVEKNLELSTMFLNEGTYLNSNRNLLQRVLINLVSNAIKFTEIGKIIVSFRLGSDSSRVVISVADTGIGIDEKYHRKIFEPFVRIALAEHSKLQGVGLGLSNARLLINQMGGEIVLKSEIGLGSMFSITLPLGETVKN